MMRRFATIVMTAAICAGLLALAPKAFAQTRLMLGAAVFGEPKIWADRLEVLDKTKTATFSGNVQLVQGDTTIRCRRLIVSYLDGVGEATAVNSLLGTPREPPRDIRHVEMLGGVTVVTTDESASADLAIYDARTKALTLFGDVEIKPKAGEQ